MRVYVIWQGGGERRMGWGEEEAGAGGGREKVRGMEGQMVQQFCLAAWWPGSTAWPTYDVGWFHRVAGGLGSLTR